MRRLLLGWLLAPTRSEVEAADCLAATAESAEYEAYKRANNGSGREWATARIEYERAALAAGKARRRRRKLIDRAVIYGYARPRE